MLIQVSHPSLQPLVYPLVQTLLGTLQVQPSAKYHPLRLHLVRMLHQLSSAMDAYIPTATFLLEVRSQWFLPVYVIHIVDAGSSWNKTQ